MFRGRSHDISSPNRGDAQMGDSPFCRIKLYIVANHASAFPSAALTVQRVEGEESYRVAGGTLSNYPGKKLGGQKRKKGNIFERLHSSDCSHRNMKIESSGPATGIRYVRSGVQLMATFAACPAKLDTRRTKEKSVLTSVILSRYIDLAHARHR